MLSSKVVVIALSVFVIFGGISTWFYLKSNGTNNTDLIKQAYEAIDLKQDILNLKSQRVSAGTAAYEFYQIGLRSEMQGDESFAQKKYSAARQTYIEAAFYLRKAKTESEQERTAALAKLAEVDEDKIKPEIIKQYAWTLEQQIETQAEELFDKALEEERNRIAREQSQKVRRESPSHSRPNEVAQSAPSNVNFATLESPISDAKKLDDRPQTEPESLKSPEIQANPAEEDAKIEITEKRDDEPVLQLALKANTDILRQKRAIENASREIQKLLDAYKGNFEKSNIDGFKTLFNSGFTWEDERAWSKFFRSVKDIRASVEGENIQIFKNNAEVQLAVLVEYSNHKGIKQNPQSFRESWTLENGNGSWVVVSRELK